MYTLEKLKKRWSDRRELNKIGKVFKMWYGITTNIMCAPYLPKDITEEMFNVLLADIKEFIQTELKYVPVENENDAKMAAILFEQYDQNLVQGFQIFVKQGDEWFTRVGKAQTLKKVEKIQLTEQDEYNSIFLEWIENVEKAITNIHILGKLPMKEVNPKRTEIIYCLLYTSPSPRDRG